MATRLQLVVAASKRDALNSTDRETVGKVANRTLRGVQLRDVALSYRSSSKSGGRWLPVDSCRHQTKDAIVFGVTANEEGKKRHVLALAVRGKAQEKCSKQAAAALTIVGAVVDDFGGHGFQVGG